MAAQAAKSLDGIEEAPGRVGAPAYGQTKFNVLNYGFTHSADSPLASVVMALVCAEVAVVMCYFQLCAEDYNWWWRAFLTSGSSAGYMLA